MATFSEVAEGVRAAIAAYTQALDDGRTGDVVGLDGWTTPDGVPLPAINRWTPFYTGVHRTGEPPSS